MLRMILKSRRGNMRYRGVMTMEKKLFEPAKLGNLTLKNRLVRSALYDGAARLDGGLKDEAYTLYSKLAKGGVGMIIAGFTSVSDNDRYPGGMLPPSRDETIPQYQKLVDIVHRENCPIITQLALTGYYRGNTQLDPTDMTLDEVHSVIQMFIDAARRAKCAGFDEVQIHAAHFLFLSQFISPAVNRRSDSYGGSTENRMRILLEIMTGIREKAPNLHLTVKINSSDFVRNGLDAAESLEICKALAKAGIDSIEVSGNSPSVPRIRAGVNEGYFAPFAAALAEQVDVPVIAVGGWRSKDTMEDVLKNTKIEFLSLSRPLLREPDLPNKLQSGACTVAECVSCNACYSLQGHCVYRIRGKRIF